MMEWALLLMAAGVGAMVAQVLMRYQAMQAARRMEEAIVEMRGVPFHPVAVMKVEGRGLFNGRVVARGLASELAEVPLPPDFPRLRVSGGRLLAGELEVSFPSHPKYLPWSVTQLVDGTARVALIHREMVR